MKIKVLGIMGKSGSGKTSIIKRLNCLYPQFSFAYGSHKVRFPKEWTTRPPRENDSLENYNFVNEFDDETEFLCRANYYNWEYGIPFSELDKNRINIMVLNRQYYDQLKDNDCIDLTTIYLDVNEDELEKRNLQRLWNLKSMAQVESFVTAYNARLKQDKTDYEDKDFVPDLILANNNDDNDQPNVINTLQDLIKKYSNGWTITI